MSEVVVRATMFDDFGNNSDSAPKSALNRVPLGTQLQERLAAKPTSSKIGNVLPSCNLLNPRHHQATMPYVRDDSASPPRRHLSQSPEADEKAGPSQKPRHTVADLQRRQVGYSFFDQIYALTWPASSKNYSIILRRRSSSRPGRASVPCVLLRRVSRVQAVAPEGI